MNKILVVDDATHNLRILVAALESVGHEVLTATDGETALSVCRRVTPDLILLDVMMAGIDGIEVCRRLKAQAAFRDVPVLFTTGLNEWEDLRRGFAAGGADYVVKPLRIEEILIRVAHHLQVARLSRELAARNEELVGRMNELQQAHVALLDETARRQQTESRLQRVDDQLTALSARDAQRWRNAGFIGSSAAMAAALAEIRTLQLSPGTTSVLITGESGTGKELVARAIHFGGTRANRPFIAVNCVAVSAELAESTFFGHVKGAFTGASGDHKGHFELANGGTLFLDEIGDMPVGLQAKLLRVLEDGMVRPVGGAREIRTDLRVVAATNADLFGKMAAGTFREDLYYRLARYHLVLPPLRERPQDIAPLARHFIELFAAEMGLQSPGITADAQARLQTYPFAGNVRELRNVIERALIRSGGSTVDIDHLDLLAPRAASAASAQSASSAASALGATGPATHDTHDDMPLNLRDAELLLMKRALQRTGGNVSEAARLLGVHRSKLYRVLP